MSGTRNFNVRVNEEEDGSLWAEVLELPGCFAAGENLDELREALEESISLYLHDRPNAGRVEDMRRKGSKARPASHMAVDKLRVKVPA